MKQKVIVMYTAKERLILHLFIIPLIFIVFMTLGVGGNSNFVHGQLYTHSTTTITETIETKVIELTDDSITIEFINKGTSDWVYSEMYSIEVYDNGIWCVIPFNESVSFIEIAYMLSPGESASHTYSLQYHTLYPGHYQIVVHSAAAEFDIK